MQILIRSSLISVCTICSDLYVPILRIFSGIFICGHSAFFVGLVPIDFLGIGIGSAADNGLKL